MCTAAGGWQGGGQEVGQMINKSVADRYHPNYRWLQSFIVGLQGNTMHSPAGHKQARKPQNTPSSIQLSAKTINVKN